MFQTLWNDFLYQPLFNGLIWIYNNWTDQNLGWAVVYLTILLRTILLPFTIIDERNKAKNLALLNEIREVEKTYQNDQILKKEEIRKIMKNRRIQPWAKAIVLGIQALVLVLLYQVFLRGITGEKILKILYDSVDFPGIINTMFYGFDLGIRHETLWAGAVGLWLLIEIYFSYRKRKKPITKADLAYFIIFPLFVSYILWLLPMVKSLFILTSMAYSAIIGRLLGYIFSPKKQA